MSFGFANTGGGAAGGVSSGADLETIQTEALGFLSIAGDAKVRLTSPWSRLPSATSSLLSIASRRGLVAAAGPDQITISSTEAVRKSFESPKDGDSDVRSFQPQVNIPMPMRVSHLTFTADENYLILSAEDGGGLAVYETQSLLQGSLNSTFELSTSGEGLRAVAPNPTPEKAELCAIITNGGNLHMANLKDRQISNPLKSQVSCLSWSSKGKQLCAGLADGSIHQMTPEGELKAEIPQPPNTTGAHVSSLTWLENHLFLAIHTASNMSPPSSVYHLITRQPPSNFEFQKVTDPVDPFGSDKVPHHSLLRLRNFPPGLSDLLIVSSTASPDVGLLSRSASPLATDKPADSITNVFTTTELLDDTKRPTLPMTSSMDDSLPIGVSLDLSSRDKVYKPIPSDEELEESPGPLPGFWLLTQEGILCAWWVIYTDAIKQGQTYPGMAAVEGSNATSTQPPAAPATAVAPFAQGTSSAFGAAAAKPAFGAASQMGQKTSPWGGAPTSSTPASTGGASFGSSTFGNTASSAAPAFGKPSTIGFGQPSQLGMRTSPFSSAGGSAPAFGQTGFASFANKSSTSPFGSGSAAPASGGFAGFANKGGFAAAAENSSGGSVFAGPNKASDKPFGSATFGSQSDTAFPLKQNKPSSNPFGSTPFKLQSSFKPDTSKDDSQADTSSSGLSILYNGLDDAVKDAVKGTATSLTAKDEDMDVVESVEEPEPEPESTKPPQEPESTTPTTSPTVGRFMGTATSPPMNTSIFGQSSKLGSTSTGLFGSHSTASSSTGFPSKFSSQPKSPASSSTVTPRIEVANEEDAPLPPDTTSKVAYPLGDSSSSSAASNAPGQHLGGITTPSKIETAPLPPDFTTTPKTAIKTEEAPLPPDFTKTAQPSDAPLPPDFVTAPKPVKETNAAPDAPLPPDFTKPVEPGAQTFGSKLTSGSASEFIAPKAPSNEPSAIPSIPESGDEESGSEDFGEDAETEGSGIDVAKDLSPSSSGLAHTPGYTPQSSFGGASKQDGKPRPLFGEVKESAPAFARPHATSPRSPSPVRGAVPNRILRSDATRSVSAPGMASHLLGSKGSPSQLGNTISGRERQGVAEDPFVLHHRRMKARQEAEEMQLLVDEEDDGVQKILASEVEPTLRLDEFTAHSNVVAPAKESIPSQVEAVYRDINAMIDTLGLNARAVKAFVKGHSINEKPERRTREDFDDADDWVLCEVSELGEVLDKDMSPSLENGRVQDVDDKLEKCHELARDMQRLRVKQDDLKKSMTARMDPSQADLAQSAPLSTEQMAQQNELRKEVAQFSNLLAEVERALALLKAKIAAVSGSTGKGGTAAPTVEAVIRTITRMTTMVEKRSGDIDVLENQLRKVRLESRSREGSPAVTPQGKRNSFFSPESTPSRNFRHSMSSSLGGLPRGTPPRKKLGGFSKDEKHELMEKRARRQAVLDKLKGCVEKRGVSVWNMEDIE